MDSRGGASIVGILGALPSERPSSIPPEYHVVRRKAVIEAGAEPQAVEAWLGEVGGYVVAVPEPISNGPATWRPKDGHIAYAVPRSALVDAPQ
jgi:hypothetical protein